jgi:predicted alpha-1,6-mannanase (GH76 family)
VASFFSPSDVTVLRSIQLPSNAVNEFEWSYNAGVAISAMTQLSLVTNNERYMLVAERVLQAAVQHFWRSGHLGESTSYLNRDQVLFKGILLHYVSEFLRVFFREKRKVPHWLVSFLAVLEIESQFVVRERLFDDGVCTYWGEFGANETCHANARGTSAFAPQGLICAARLFALTDQVRRILEEQR